MFQKLMIKQILSANRIERVGESVYFYRANAINPYKLRMRGLHRGLNTSADPQESTFSAWIETGYAQYFFPIRTKEEIESMWYVVLAGLLQEG